MLLQKKVGSDDIESKLIGLIMWKIGQGGMLLSHLLQEPLSITS